MKSDGLIFERRITEHEIGYFRPLDVQKQAALNRSWVQPVLLSNPD